MSMSRREFLLSSGALVLVGGSAPLLNGCAGLQRADIEQTDGDGGQTNTGVGQIDEDVGQTGGAASVLQEDEWHILELAALAPSGHNTQPWAIRAIAPYHWIIQSDAQRWLPAVDPEQRETLLSIGAFMENMVVAAGCHGYDTHLKILAKKTIDKDIAEVRLHRKGNTVRDQEAIERITHRRVIRKGYLSKEIAADDLHWITSGDTERFHYFSPSSRQSRYLAAGTVEANRFQAYRDAAQNELAYWIRWPDDDAKRHRDGLTPEGMEIGGLAGWWVRHFYDRSDVLKPGFREATVDMVKEQTERHGGWLVMTSADPSVDSLLETGRLFERMFLLCRSRMIAIHPMTQMLEETPWKHAVGRELGLSAPVQFLLRVGYLEAYPDPVTLRRPAPWFVTS